MDAHKLDATNLAERLRWEQQEYWLHLEAASALEKYPAKQHARRVQEKLGVSDGLIYLPGLPLLNYEDSDMPATFRQRRYFYYMSGVDEPDCSLVYDIRNDVLTLFVPRFDAKGVIWNGRGSTPAEALDRYDIDQALWADALQTFVKDWLMSHHGDIYLLHASYGEADLSGPRHRVDSQSLLPAMNLARMVKDEHEIKMIRKANDISSQAHKEVLANILRFKNEAQVEGLFINFCMSKHAKRQAYNVIAASGPNAGTLHYGENDQDFEDRQLMCLDAGCEYKLYASDITRTFPLSGNWPSKEAEDIYRLVQRMQETCIGRIAPGVRYLDLQILAHQIAIDGLLNLGIFHNGSREEIYKAGTSKAFFPHGLGHHVGLEVHDVGQADLMSVMQSNAAPSLYPENFHLPVYDAELCFAPADPQSPHLQEGNVVTIEPGIYFSIYALEVFYLHDPVHSKYINFDVVKRYLPVGGVRLEDDILVTSKGHENLTTAPKGEVMLEIIRSQNAQWPFVSDSADFEPTSKPTEVESKPKEQDQPLLRAPGFSQRASPALKPILRAATMPVERKDRKSVDFEPFDGPSLFAGFKRASTVDPSTGFVQPSTSRHSLSYSTSLPKTTEVQSRVPICGEDSSDVKHVYMGFPADTDDKPACRQCSILIQTLGRLRHTLSKVEEASPSPGSVVPNKPASEEQPLRRPSATKPVAPEMVQCHRSTQDLFVSSSRPDGLSSKAHRLHPERSMTSLDRLPLQTQKPSLRDSMVAVPWPVTTTNSHPGTTRPPLGPIAYPRVALPRNSEPLTFPAAPAPGAQVIPQQEMEIAQPPMFPMAGLNQNIHPVHDQSPVTINHNLPAATRPKQLPRSMMACQQCMMTKVECINDGQGNACLRCKRIPALESHCIYTDMDTLPQPCAERPVLPDHTALSSNPEHGNRTLQDHQLQLMLLEQSHKKRILQLRQEQDNTFTSHNNQPVTSGSRSLSQKSYTRPPPNPIRSVSSLSSIPKPRNSSESFSLEQRVHQTAQSYSGNSAFQGSLPTPAQDYQLQLMMLENQNKKRLLMARQEQENMSEQARPCSFCRHMNVRCTLDSAGLANLSCQNCSHAGYACDRSSTSAPTATVPIAQQPMMHIGDNTTARPSNRVTSTTDSSTPAKPAHRLSRIQEDKMSKLHEAMDALWSVREDMEREFVTTFSDLGTENTRYREYKGLER